MAAGTGAAAQQPAGPDPALAPYASRKDSVRLPDGRTLHLVCMGQGGPLVILTGGAADWSLVWSKVQPAIARTTRVCAWDKAGFGLSSPSRRPQTVADSTDDLQAALKAAGLRGPYVAVGHSLGALQSLLLKDRAPSRVLGMVLVDPAFPGQRAAYQQVAPAAAAWERANPDPAFLFLTKCAAAVRAGTVRPGGPDPDRCLPAPQWPPAFPPELRDALTRQFAEAAPEEIAERLEIAAAYRDTALATRDSEAAVRPGRSYGDMPLIVLTADEAAPPPPDLPADVRSGLIAFRAETRRAHRALAALSARGVDRIVPGAAHMIPLEKPQAVIDAVEEVLAELKASRAAPAGR